MLSNNVESSGSKVSESNKVVTTLSSHHMSIHRSKDKGRSLSLVDTLECLEVTQEVSKVNVKQISLFS
ncbi:hypothetical protein D3C80_2053290 [compost metagenome]